MVKKYKSEEAGLLEVRLKHLFEYGVDLGSRVITFSEDIDEGCFQFIDAAMSELERNGKEDITIRLNSQGGSVYEALAMVGRIRLSKSRVITEGYGAIMSATTLLLACGDHRKISKFAWFMHHESSYQGLSGKLSEIGALAKQGEREELKWAEFMEKFTDKPKVFWKKKGVGVDVYFSPEELLEMGVVDEIF
jgi:ATP-dependent protease ClpP protease subunit